MHTSLPCDGVQIDVESDKLMDLVRSQVSRLRFSDAQFLNTTNAAAVASSNLNCYCCM